MVSFIQVFQQKNCMRVLHDQTIEAINKIDIYIVHFFVKMFVKY
jgi:hypothetical protein